MDLPFMDTCPCIYLLLFTYSSQCCSGSLSTTYSGTSISLSDFWALPISATLTYYTTSVFLSICVVMVPHTFTLSDITPCTMSASHLHALTLPWGPICPPLGHNLSISANTSNAGDTHNALVFIPHHILHHHLLILDLVIDTIFSTSSVMLC